jgi:GNAT superfamily N-acetyltransferase
MLRAPEALNEQHDIESFDSGVASLDDWLKRRALHNQQNGASRTFVACEGDKVIAYYALASGAVAAANARGRFRRNMPDPIPVVVLARLAVARSHQSKGLGRALFQDAALRVVHAADSIGIRGLLVHALTDDAKTFYLRLGLEESPLEPMTLMATVADLRAAIR